jgi:hypothetical protein
VKFTLLNRQGEPYTMRVLQQVAEYYGHSFIPDIAGADAALYSICDVTEAPDLKRAHITAQKAGKVLIAGGQFCYMYKSAVQLADMVNVGHAFDLFKCKTLADIERLPCVYVAGKTGPVRPSTFIDWRAVRAANTSPKTLYYWGGTGCRFKCRFCYISNTNPHTINPYVGQLIKRVEQQHTDKNIMIVSNEYDSSTKKTKAKDMLIREYLKMPQQTKLIRMGLEFATEAARKKNGKAVTQEMVLQAISKAARDKNNLRFFVITGYEPVSAWYDFFNMLPGMPYKQPVIQFMFNNLEYQLFTPMHAERYDMDPAQYMTQASIKDLFYEVVLPKHKNVRLYPPSNFAHVACRMGVSWATNAEQMGTWLQLWRDVKKTRLEHMDFNRYKTLLWETGVIDTEYTDKDIVFSL